MQHPFKHGLPHLITIHYGKGGLAPFVLSVYVDVDMIKEDLYSSNILGGDCLMQQ